MVGGVRHLDREAGSVGSEVVGRMAGGKALGLSSYVLGVWIWSDEHGLCRAMVR